MALFAEAKDPQVEEVGLRHRDEGADIDSDDELYGPNGAIGSRLKHVNPSGPMLLGKFSVMCFIANRMIGSGVFLTTSTIMHHTHSVGITMVFWLVGAITTMCGALMFIEYGLTSPRYPVDGATDGRKVPVARSGGELNYLKDMFKKPAFFAVSVYGIAFILLGNIAINSLAFGVRSIQASGNFEISEWSETTEWQARGIALVAITAVCALHTVWRLGGIYLSNIFAIVKVSMLILIFITGCLFKAGVFPVTERTARNNEITSNAFSDPSPDIYSYASAYLTITWTYGGFNQANYILGEIRDPKKNFKWPAFISALVVCILFILVNTAYMLVVPAEEQAQWDTDVATRFFELTFGALTSDAAVYAPRILHAFMAVSAMGNLIVFTFAAARVKQEIAKEGIIPFRHFFANSKVVFGQRDNPVPFGALFLHWGISVVMIFATARLAPLSAYRILVNLFSYAIDVVFRLTLSVGIFVLRFRRGGSFAANSFLSGWVSCSVAAIYGLSLAFPAITNWIPPTSATERSNHGDGPWFLTPVLSWSILGLGALWWIGFTRVYPLKHPGKQLVVRRTLFVNEHGVMDHEIVQFDWPPKEDDVQSLSEDNHLRFVDPLRARERFEPRDSD